MHLNCPHCDNPIEVIEEPTLEEVLCPSCGSSIRVETGSTAGWFPKDGGRRLGKFELIDIVGVGAFGTVFMARDTKLERIVAIKIPRTGNLTSGEDLNRFLGEARMLAQLRHPSIVPIYDVGQQDGLPYLVSEFVRGTTLADLLSVRRLTFREVAELISSIADALDVAHRHGIVHRDVKPSNIMLERDESLSETRSDISELGTPRLMDFGLAKQDAAEITMTLDGQIIGTPAYMSPEQAKGESHDVDGRSDVYSLGVVLYEVLTGERPFRGTRRMLIYQVAYDEPRSPRTLNDHIPKELATICLKAMAKEPSRRYQIAKALAEDLRRHLRGEPIHARPMGGLGRLTRWCKRNPRVAALSGAVVLLGLVISIASPIVAVRESNLRQRAEQQANLAAEQTRIAREATQKRERMLCKSYLEHGLALCETGDVARGMFSLIRGLQVTSAHAHDLVNALRANLASWDQTIHRLIWMTDTQDFGPISAAINRQDGKRIFAASDNALQVYDAKSGERLGKPTQFPSRITAFAVSQDSKVAAVAGQDHQVRIRDLVKNLPRSPPIQHDGPVLVAELSGDAAMLLTGSLDGTAALWRADQGNLIGSKLQHGGFPLGGVLTENDALLVTAHASTARLWSVKSGQPVGVPLEHQGSILTAAFSADAKTLITGCDDQMARIWDAETGLPIGEPLEHNDWVVRVAISQKDDVFVTGSLDGTVRLWQLSDRKPIGRPLEHELPVTVVTLSQDAHAVLVGTRKSVRLWSVTRPTQSTAFLVHARPINAVALSPDGNRLATASKDNAVRMWSVSPKRLLTAGQGHKDWVLAIDWQSTGDLVASASRDHTARIWDGNTGQPTGITFRHSGPVHDVVFSPDGEKVATASRDQTAQIWNIETGERVGLPLKHSAPVQSVIFSPDGARLLTGSVDKTAHLWDARTGKSLRVLQHEGPVNVVNFSPSGSLAISGSTDGTARLWDGETGQPRGTTIRHSDAIQDVVFSLDGKRVATASRDHTAQVWDVETGHPIGVPLEHKRAIVAVAFDSEGATVATASADHTARLWDATTGIPIGPEVRHNDRVSIVAFDPQRRFLVTGSDDHRVQIRRLSTALTEETDQILRQTEIATGMQLQPSGTVLPLDPDSWAVRMGQQRKPPDQAASR